MLNIQFFQFNHQTHETHEINRKMNRRIDLKLKKNLAQLIILSLSFTTNTVFAGQAAIANEDLEERNRYAKVKPDDKLKSTFIRTNFFKRLFCGWTTLFMFKDAFDIGWRETEKLLDEKSVFYKIMTATNDKRILENIKLYIEEEKKRRDLDTMRQYARNILKIFNTWLAKSPENRDKISLILAKDYENKIRLEKQRQEKFRKATKGRKLFFIGPNLGYSFRSDVFNSSSSSRLTEFFIGFSMYGFFLNPLKIFNIGYTLSINYDSIKRIYVDYSGRPSSTGSYLDINAGLIFKLGVRKSLFCSIGYNYMKKLSKTIDFFDSYYMGMKFNLGYLYITPDFSNSLFIGVDIKLSFESGYGIRSQTYGLMFAFYFNPT